MGISSCNERFAPVIAVGARRGSPLGPVPGSYLRALAAAGARPVVLEPHARTLAAADELLAPCAGLLLTGGGDVDPALYGGAAGGGQDDVDELRDACELALLRAASARGLPVLAICHGMQLVNVARGGTLAQQLPPQLAGAHGTSAAWREHPVGVRAGSRLAAAVACERLAACSSHHQQAVARLGDGLVETGWSDDGVIEAIEDADGNWIVGVQWHPEDIAARDAEQQRIFDTFAAQARGVGAAGVAVGAGGAVAGAAGAVAGAGGAVAGAGAVAGGASGTRDGVR